MLELIRKNAISISAKEFSVGSFAEGFILFARKLGSPLVMKKPGQVIDSVFMEKLNRFPEGKILFYN